MNRYRRYRYTGVRTRHVISLSSRLARIMHAVDQEQHRMNLAKTFNKLAQSTAKFTGHPVCFCMAMAVIVIWAATGPLFGFSEVWQLVINTGTTIITFLMVFLIQNTQNRDTEAMQIKLDELIYVTRMANNELLDLEELEEAELDRLRERYEDLARKAKAERARKAGDTKPGKA
jgi:low affinity Fe/Cu permease